MTKVDASYELFDKEDFDEVVKNSAVKYIRANVDEQDAKRLYYEFMSEHAFDYQLGINGFDADEDEEVFEEISALQREDMMLKFYEPFMDLYNKIHCGNVIENE